jgi:hypothetical protein
VAVCVFSMLRVATPVLEKTEARVSRPSAFLTESIPTTKTSTPATRSSKILVCLEGAPSNTSKLLYFPTDYDFDCEPLLLFLPVRRSLATAHYPTCIQNTGCVVNLHIQYMYKYSFVSILLLSKRLFVSGLFELQDYCHNLARDSRQRQRTNSWRAPSVGVSYIMSLSSKVAESGRDQCSCQPPHGIAHSKHKQPTTTNDSSTGKCQQIS